jgi:hypothetical protein
LQSTKALLILSSDYWSNKSLLPSNSTLFFPSNSSLPVPGRSFMRQSFGSGGYDYHTNILPDLLSKREFIYRS